MANDNCFKVLAKSAPNCTQYRQTLAQFVFVSVPLLLFFNFVFVRNTRNWTCGNSLSRVSVTLRRKIELSSALRRFRFRCGALAAVPLRSALLGWKKDLPPPVSPQNEVKRKLLWGNLCFPWNRQSVELRDLLKESSLNWQAFRLGLSLSEPWALRKIFHCFSRTSHHSSVSHQHRVVHLVDCLLLLLLLDPGTTCSRPVGDESIAFTTTGFIGSVSCCYIQTPNWRVAACWLVAPSHMAVAVCG